MTPRSKDTSRIPLEMFANLMRMEPTRHELLMYDALLQAFRPYRATVHSQEPIGPYVADFYIAPSNVVIEVDGASHDTTKAYDSRRNEFMRSRDIRVMRFKNRQVERNPAAVAQYILERCLPLPAASGNVKVTICPPGSGFTRKARANKRLFWLS